MKEQKGYQTSESIIVSILLAISGGFQDAYTFCVRDEVFANAQTGNIVMIGHSLMTGQWIESLRYLFPVIAFAFGVFLAETLGYYCKRSKPIHWRQMIVGIELTLLFVVGFLPQSYNLLATVLVSFACSMQVQAFRKIHGHIYASTMCIGNLRSGTEHLSRYARWRQPHDLKLGLGYYGIITIFAIGAGLGGVCSGKFQEKTIWICVILLLIVCFLMSKKRIGGDKSCIA